MISLSFSLAHFFSFISADFVSINILYVIGVQRAEQMEIFSFGGVGGSF